MSKHVVSLVYRKKIGSMMRKAVLSYMADRANDDGSGVWCSKATIANEIEASRQGVITTIKSLLSDGLLVEDGKRPCANGFTIEYRIDLQKVHALPFVTGKNMDGSKSVPVKEVDGAASTGLTSHVNVVDPNRPEPSLEPSKGSDIFSEAWKIWNGCKLKASAQKRKPAAAAWKVACKKSSPEQLLSAVRSAVDLRDKAEGFYPALPHMHRWLQREEWLDVETKPETEAMTREDWAAAMREFVETGAWVIPDVSPAPNQPGCLAPIDMLDAWRKHYAKEQAA